MLAEDQAQLAQERIAEHARVEEVRVAEQLHLLDFILGLGFRLLCNLNPKPSCRAVAPA